MPPPLRLPYGAATSIALVSWVPPSLVELVHRGIAVKPEECIVWLDRGWLRDDEPLGEPIGSG